MDILDVLLNDSEIDKMDNWIVSKEIESVISDNSDEEDIAEDVSYDACGKKKKDGKIGEVMVPEGGKYSHERMRRPIKGAEYRTKKMENGTLVRLMKIPKGKDKGKWVAQAILKPVKKDSYERIEHNDWWEVTPSKFKETPEGYLKGEAIVTNIGVFPYLNNDGSIRKELRLPEEVFSNESIQSLLGKPITNNHPSEKVDINNISKYSVGMTGDQIISDPYHLMIGLTITDKKTIQDIKNGKQALSCGYDCDLENAENGAKRYGQSYDKIQRNIRYNHIAIVDSARAGEKARIHMDSAINIDKLIKEEIMELKKITLDGVEYQAEAEVLKTLNTEKARADTLATELSTIKTDKSKIEAERDTFKAQSEKVSKELETLKKSTVDSTKVNELVKEKIDILDIASKIKVEVKDGMNNEDIKKAIIVAKFPGTDLTGKDSAYIQGRYDSVVVLIKAETETKADASVRFLTKVPPSKDGEIDINKKKEEFNKRLHNAYLNEKKEE